MYNEEIAVMIFLLGMFVYFAGEGRCRGCLWGPRSEGGSLEVELKVRNDHQPLSFKALKKHRLCLGLF